MYGVKALKPKTSTMLFEVSNTMFDMVCADRLSSGLSCLALGDINMVLLDLGLPDSTGLSDQEQGER
ncbi:MAG: hypothetical protein C5S41_09955 [Candidatus Methanomarinus sp.]|nr:MAG: hypothetical protein C5S41_09955 [ANME-2 cluster archaeon]